MSPTHFVRSLLLLTLLALSALASAAPLGTAFTYQGQLRDGVQPANGLYDFQFRLMDQASAGNVIAGPLVLQDIPVENGIFSVSIDFGASFNGDARWLEISVRNGASAGSFDLLSPRQTLSAAPYAMYALSGNQGPPGPQGPSGIVQLQGFAGNVSTIAGGGPAAPFVFAGPTTTLTVALGQRLVGAGTASIAHVIDVEGIVSYSLCYRVAGQGGSLMSFAGANFTDTRFQRHASLSATVRSAPLAAATYEVGFCIKNKTGNSLSGNDYANGWVMVVD